MSFGGFKSSMKSFVDKSKSEINSLSNKDKKKDEKPATPAATNTTAPAPVYTSSSSTVTTTTVDQNNRVTSNTSTINASAQGNTTYYGGSNSQYQQVPPSQQYQAPPRPSAPPATYGSGNQYQQQQAPPPQVNRNYQAPTATGGAPPPRPPKPTTPTQTPYSPDGANIVSLEKRSPTPSTPTAPQQTQPNRLSTGAPPQPPINNRYSPPAPQQQPPTNNRYSPPPPLTKDGASVVSLEKKQPPSQSYNYQQQPQQQQQQQYQYLQPKQQQNVALEKKTDAPSVDKIQTNLKKHTDYVDTHSKIALHSIGVPMDTGIVKANIPPLLLSDQLYLANIQYQEIILEIEEATIKSIQYGQKSDPIHKKQKLIIYKTNIEEVILIQLYDIYIYTNLKEKPCFRAYPFHYIISDNEDNIYMIKMDKDTPEDSMNKLEVILMYYSTYYRVPIKQEFNDKTAQKMDKATSGVEKASMGISKGLVTGGTYFAKGASKVGEVYKNNTKKYEGPEMTEEQKRELEDPNSELNKSGKGTEKFAQGTASVSKGIVQGFGFVGSKVSQGVRSTDWYKEREAKEKEKERLYGKNEKKEAGGNMASTGVGALCNIWGGLEEGVLISCRGVRDASVDATRHTKGDYAAEKSKKGWDAAGNVTISVINVMSIVSATWIKGALYAAAGAISYDPDKVQSVTGAYWRAGWLATKSDLLSGSTWRTRWVVIRNPTIAVYSNSTDPADKPLVYTYLSKVKGVQKLSFERSQKEHSFEVLTNEGSLYFSCDTPTIDYSEELVQPPSPEDNISQWTNTILSVSAFIGEIKIE
ncbi:hypothetical protein CYY_009452 [Polysphondylium violaceum]|uniref:PH domain-containing protein n=1 Tax=Polysphondylium violaceum TaxID=133409 RepID=A0A8J4V0H7_9MYCE|nr:hypothetical protein CYY_009452 [Polysphondylium violaceum]